MMSNPGNRSLGTKLTLIGLLTSGAALALAFSGFMAYECAVFHRTRVESHEITGRIIGQRCAPLLDRGEVEGAAQELRALAVHPRIDGAILFDANARVLDRYRRQGAENSLSPKSDPSVGHRWSLAGFRSVVPVVLAGQQVGILQLDSSLDELGHRLISSAVVGVAV